MNYDKNDKYKIKLDQKYNLVQSAMVNISKMIREQHLQPGSRLPSESELCNILNVSRVVIREAIAGLSALGIIEVRHGYGSVVSDIANTIIKPHNLYVEADFETVLEAMDLRLVIESGVARVAALNRKKDDLLKIEEKYAELLLVMNDDKNIIDLISEKDFNFHMAIAESTGNKFICRVLSDITDILKLTINESFKKNPTYLQKALEEHRKIIEAIKDKDPDAAYSAMEKHLVITKLTLTEKYYKE